MMSNRHQNRAMFNDKFEIIRVSLLELHDTGKGYRNITTA